MIIQQKAQQPYLIMVILAFVLILSACQQKTGPTLAASQGDSPSPTPIRPSSTPTPTLTPSFTPSPSHTPTATPTPTITPTPTPTAPPITVNENLPQTENSPPVITSSAPCGLVDTLDFPLDPPDGINVRGGGDFGVFRSRYDKYHAGEDWWATSGQSFGKPVYSIGHGLVTYAEPEGWGRDKGVIIIQHTLNNGAEVLSFYGHLDPPSVLLSPGACVVRGQQIAQIGRPRSSPHLHFEIRTQAPYETLTGYWPEDPTTVGWLPPSAFIWSKRFRATPGVLWTLPVTFPYANEGIEQIGLYDQQTIITLQSEQLTGVSVEDGRLLWQLDNSEDEEGITAVYQALIDNRFPIVYIANRSGQVQALSLLSDQSDTIIPTLQPLWEVDLELFGQPDLLPLADGGLLFAGREELVALDSEGSILWQREEIKAPTNSLLLSDSLLLTASGSEAYFGTADTDGLHLWENDSDNWPSNAIPVLAGEQRWLYARDGLYRLDLNSQTAELQYPLPRGLTSLGDILALSDGGLLLAHADTADRRLLAFNPDGSLRWERSYEEVISGSVQLFEQNGRIYLIDINNSSQDNTFSIYTIDLNNASLTQIFYGGSRSGNLGQTWILPADDRLIINIEGGVMLAFDPLH